MSTKKLCHCGDEAVAESKTRGPLCGQHIKEGEALTLYAPLEMVVISGTLPLPENSLFYVQDSRQYVGNCVMWWRLGGGYTTEIKDAELFTADQLKRMRDTDVPWAQDVVMASICQHVRIEHLQEQARMAGGASMPECIAAEKKEPA